MTGLERQNCDVLQTVVIGGHHWYSHSRHSGTVEVGNDSVLAEAAGTADNATKVQDMARKAEKQTCVVESESPGMAETRSWSRCHSLARTPAPQINRF